MVFNIAQHYNSIFDIASSDFLDKAKRVNMPEVQQLRSIFQYEFVNGRPKIDTFYRHKCLLRVGLLVSDVMWW